MTPQSIYEDYTSLYIYILIYIYILQCPAGDVESCTGFMPRRFVSCRSVRAALAYTIYTAGANELYNAGMFTKCGAEKLSVVFTLGKAHTDCKSSAFEMPLYDAGWAFERRLREFSGRVCVCVLRMEMYRRMDVGC